MTAPAIERAIHFRGILYLLSTADGGREHPPRLPFIRHFHLGGPPNEFWSAHIRFAGETAPLGASTDVGLCALVPDGWFDVRPGTVLEMRELNGRLDGLLFITEDPLHRSADWAAGSFGP